MAGVWNQSLSQLYDENGKPMVGARAYFYAAATTTPIEVYGAFDLGAVNALPNPLSTDGFGRWPAVYLDEADGFFRVRVTTAGGVVVYDQDGLPIIGPTGGGGGAPTPVDPNSVLSTGDMLLRYGEGLRAGFVRNNGRTIGSATSGASERSNSDVQPLFEHLWNADPNLVVLGGRGASSAADWAANKQLTLPDIRGRALIGMDTMGNIAANVIVEANALGWKGGERDHTLTIPEIPFHNHGGQTGGGVDVVPVTLTDLLRNLSGSLSLSGGGNVGFVNLNVPMSNHYHVIPGQGGGAKHNNIQPAFAIPVYIRL